MDALLIPVFILFGLLVPVLALMLLLYAVPVRAAATLIHTADDKKQTVKVSWSIIAFRISGYGAGQVIEALILDHVIVSHTMPREIPEEKHDEEIIPEQVLGSNGKLDAGELIRIVQRMTGPVGTFLSVFREQSRFENATGTVTLGLGSPSVTGEVYGFYWASRFILLASRIDIGMRPVFDRVVLELDLTVREKIEHPLLVLIAGLTLFFDPATQDTIKAVSKKQPGVAGA